MNINWIPYNKLHSDEIGFSKLFIDYIENFSYVKDFFAEDFHVGNQWIHKIEAVLNKKLNRSALIQILMEQNRNFQCGVKTLANIDLLLNDNTLAIVTGQQLGLFGGPLYTLYKIITTLKFSEYLNDKYSDYNFVPIFWLEGEDHDFQEVSSINLINKSNEVISLKYDKSYKSSDSNLGGIGELKFDDTINSIFQQLNESILETEFSNRITSIFSTAYQKGMTFKSAFVLLINALFENSGLIFFDPHNNNSKKMLDVIFEKELRNISNTCQLVINQSDIIEKRYHAQVKPRPINLFMFYNGGRYAIEPHPKGFSLKGTRKIFSLDEMLGFLQNNPNIFSPNVVLRPICQDYLFPTLAYVAGPSEIAYFAQLKKVYENFDIEEPIIYPRASVTIVEEYIQKVIIKYDLNPLEFFGDIELLKSKVANKLNDFNIEKLFSSTYGTITENLISLQDGLKKIDPTLLPALQNTLKKINHSIDVLKEKTIIAQKRQHEISLNQLNKVSSHIYPNSNLQEREINIIYFLNKYGEDFIQWLSNEIVIDKFMHQLIIME